MKKIVSSCTTCEGRKFSASTTIRVYQLGETVFKADVPSRRCDHCGEGFVHLEDLRRAHLAIAAVVAKRGPVNGAAFKFMREAMQLTGIELAELLQTSVGTVSRWENGARPVDRASWVLLSGLVLEKLAGRADTLDRIRGLKVGRLPKTVRVEIDP